MLNVLACEDFANSIGLFAIASYGFLNRHGHLPKLWSSGERNHELLWVMRQFFNGTGEDRRKTELSFPAPGVHCNAGCFGFADHKREARQIN